MFTLRNLSETTAVGHASQLFFLKWSLAVVLLCGGALQISAAELPTVALHPMYSNKMVIQRGVPSKVFGTATGTGVVTVRINGQTKTTTVAAGAWSVILDAMAAGGPYNLEVAGANTLTVSGVDVGEVWLLSGQSNTSQPLSNTPLFDGAKADVLPGVRFYIKDLGWLDVNGGGFPNQQYMFAQGYFFAKKLHQDTGIAVGCMQAGMPNTDIGAWVDPQTTAELNVTQVDWDSVGWCFRRHVEPLAGYTIGGLVWNQGENDSHREESKDWYATEFSTMVKNWRNLVFGCDFKVIVVQLPHLIGEWQTPQVNPVELGDGIAAMRHAQYEAMAISKTIVIPTYDSADGDIHPNNKDVTGVRIALAAHFLNGNTAQQAVGPIYERQEMNGRELKLFFQHSAGLRFKNGASDITGMAIAGADNLWSWAHGRIEGGTLILTSDTVPSPTQARYMWADHIVYFGNVENATGIPLHGFKSNGKPIILISDIPNVAPTIVMAAHATPNPVTGVSTQIDVLAADDSGENNLTYMWSSLEDGATFTPNGSHAAQSATVSFSHAGVFHLVATVSDASGATVSSAVTVTVVQTVSSLAVLPLAVVVEQGAQVDFNVTGLDQFGIALFVMPTCVWSATGGAIDAQGTFTAGGVSGEVFQATVQYGALLAHADITVTSAVGPTEPPAVDPPSSESPITESPTDSESPAADSPVSGSSGGGGNFAGSAQQGDGGGDCGAGAVVAMLLGATFLLLNSGLKARFLMEAG